MKDALLQIRFPGQMLHFASQLYQPPCLSGDAWIACSDAVAHISDQTFQVLRGTFSKVSLQNAVSIPLVGIDGRNA